MMDGTTISGKNLDFLAGGERTPEELVEFLKTEAKFRQFDDVLRRVYPGADLASRLERGMAEAAGETGDGRTGPDVARKVQNWLRGKNIPKNREMLFRICFVLGLKEREASLVLGTASETGIHYRNPKELVYAYGLRTGLSYRRAAELWEELRGQDPVCGGQQAQRRAQSADGAARSAQSAADAGATRSAQSVDGVGAARSAQSAADAGPACSAQSAGGVGSTRWEGICLYTCQLRDVFSEVRDEAGLKAFFRDHGEQLGWLHETAYRRFAELMELLLEPEGRAGQRERRYTVEELAETYLRMHVPKTKKTADYSMLQKVVKKYWPGESSLMNMLNRKEDVSRKVLILLYLITERFDEDDEEEFFFEAEEEDADTVLAGRFERMNLFLDGCGMNLLDAGNPFDFLVLYAMRAQCGEAVSDRMDAVLALLFDDGKKL